MDALAAFLKQAGWQCIYGINLGGAATGATTPALAAAEVAYVAQKFGSALLGIEIGNECDGYGAVGSYFAGNWSLAQFESLWEDFRSTIVAAVPGVSVTGPASGSNVFTWTVPFGQSVTSRNLSLLTQHYYRGDGRICDLHDRQPDLRRFQSGELPEPTECWRAVHRRSVPDRRVQLLLRRWGRGRKRCLCVGTMGR